MAFNLPFLKPTSRAAQTSAMSTHNRKSSLPEYYSVCQQKSFAFETKEDLNASVRTATQPASKASSPRKIKKRQIISDEGRGQSDESTQTNFFCPPTTTGKKKESGTISE